MKELAVVEAGGAIVFEEITLRLKTAGAPLDFLSLRKAESCAELRGTAPHVLLLTEGGAPAASDQGLVRCGILLLPGDVCPKGIDARCNVTYGMSPKDTITLSSIGEAVCVLAIQREFLTAADEIVERQELKVMGGLKPVSLLAVVGTLLVLGVKLSDLALV